MRWVKDGRSGVSKEMADWGCRVLPGASGGTRCALSIAYCVLLACVPVLFAWDGAPSPFDKEHLVVVRPPDFRDAGGPVKPVAEPGAAFGQAVQVVGPVSAGFTIRAAGDYVLWVRAAQVKGVQTPIEVEIVACAGADGKPGAEPSPVRSWLQAPVRINEGAGSAEHGGPAGYEAYSKQALKTKPGGAAIAEEGELPGGEKPAGKQEAEEAEEAELLSDLGQGPKTKERWIHLLRVEQPKPPKPFYWWKVGQVRLEKGGYELGLKPIARPSPAPKGEGVAPGKAAVPPSTEPERAPLVDAAFLATCDEVVYPYTGDIDAPRASYIRFRIDALPKTGITISASIRVHYDPWGTGAVFLNPMGMDAKRQAPHTKTGFTPWYCLQKIERAPGLGGEGHLLLNISGGESKDPVPAGATQFAVFPHQDYVLREISWSEPEGCHVTMNMEFESNLHLLRTFRDQAREHYEWALAATGGRVFPLTRGPLYFGNAWGAAQDSPYEYMVKTFRLLGFNSVGCGDAARSRELYGWTSAGGEYWPPTFMPYDEEKARQQYDEFYAHHFDGQTEAMKGMSIFQLADEPGEISRGEMTAPYWLYEQTKEGGKWTDVPGGSELNSKKCDFHDCVLEGKVEQHGDNFTFRVGIDNPEKPSRFAFWTVGRVAWSYTVNLAVGTVGFKGASGTLARPGASVGRTPTPFKIVYEGTSAALYLNNALIHMHEGLPRKGGFGFAGPPKAVCELRFRPIEKGEHITSKSAQAASEDLNIEGGAKETESEELFEEAEAKPDWMRPKPIEQAVKEDWVWAGGIPEAHPAFRKWAAAQGLKPDLFGKKSWDEVRMLTIPSLVRTPEDARAFYWSRRYSGYLTPKMFALAADAIHKHAPNKAMLSFVALSGHALYFPSETPLDMFQLAQLSPWMMPGISDWMSHGSWQWDSHQAVAYSVAFYNAGARRYGERPVTFPMMHCVWPSTFRAYTMVANNVKHVSYYNFGPSYMVTEGYWSDAEGCYSTCHLMNNRAAQVDDILSPGWMRHSRVALLYAMSNEYWNAQSSFADKRAAFLALSHEYYQPEMINEDQVADGALKHYDALYVLDPIVTSKAQEQIAGWVNEGGLLWTCADSLRWNEFREPEDLVARLGGVKRTFEAPAEKAAWPVVRPEGEGTGSRPFRPHTVYPIGIPAKIEVGEGRIRARYDDGRPAWIERAVGKGKVVYIGHRCGVTYSSKGIRQGGTDTIWPDTGRALLTAPLHEARIDRELWLSENTIVASPISTEDGTVIVLYNMNPGPKRNVEVVLKEAQKPHSVEVFDGLDLVQLPYEYKDGRVRARLEQLDGGQMVVVRRRPAPKDDRLDATRSRTEKQLAATDWQSLSAGAWFAGFFPGWNLADKIVPLLKHERWEVRRVAAESLARLGKPETADAVAAAAEKETDAHALGDMLYALGSLGHKDAPDRCLAALLDPPALPLPRASITTFTRRQALRGMIAFCQRGAGPRTMRSGDVPPRALKAAELGLSDPDFRVRSEAIRLTGLLDGKRTLAYAAQAFGAGRPADPGTPVLPYCDASLDRPAWAAAVAGNDEALAEYMRSGLPGDELLLAVAQRRAHPDLAKAMIERLDSLAATNGGLLVWAAVTQNDKALVRKIFEKRKTMPPPVHTYLPFLLERTFEAHLGQTEEGWEEWLKAN